jgi:hypothetical protein
MKLNDDEYDLLYKKLEYKFKNSGNSLVSKIKEHEDLTDDDIALLLKKLEYTFRKGDNSIISKLQSLVGLDGESTIKYSNIKAKQKKDIREKEKEEVKKLKHIKEFKNF